MRSELRLKYEAFALFGGVPKRFDVPQRGGLCLELERLFSSRLKELSKGTTDLIKRGAAKAAAKEFEARTTQSCCVQGDRFPALLPICTNRIRAAASRSPFCAIACRTVSAGLPQT